MLQASDEHVDALGNYVKHTLKCPDAVLRSEGNRIHISYGSVRPICPYHKRVHDAENMFGRVHNGKEAQGVMLYCHRETQGEIKWNDRVLIPTEEIPIDMVTKITKEITTVQ